MSVREALGDVHEYQSNVYASTEEATVNPVCEYCALHEILFVGSGCLCMVSVRSLCDLPITPT